MVQFLTRLREAFKSFDAMENRVLAPSFFELRRSYVFLPIGVWRFV